MEKTKKMPGEMREWKKMDDFAEWVSNHHVNELSTCLFYETALISNVDITGL